VPLISVFALGESANLTAVNPLALPLCSSDPLGAPLLIEGEYIKLTGGPITTVLL
jgi:hypothetical protein